MRRTTANNALQPPPLPGRLRKNSLLPSFLGGAALQRCGKCIVLNPALAAAGTALAQKQLLPQPAKHARPAYDTVAKALRVACACALLAAATCVAAQTSPPEPPPQTKHAIPPRSRLQGVPNFGKVTPTLYRGGQPNKQGFANLAKLGVDIVVDLRGSRAGERRTVTGLGMKYVAIPWRCFHPRDEVFARFLTLLRDNPGKKVFVHCKVGDDRTGMNIAAYRMAEQGWTPEDAKKEMALYGVDWFHRTICPGLASYETNFPKRFQTSPAFQDLRRKP